MSDVAFQILLSLGGMAVGVVLLIVCDPRMWRVAREEWCEWRSKR